MLIIYGLSNNEKKYNSTKHNIGRLVIESVLKKLDLRLRDERTYYYTKSNIAETETVFLLSKGYMNESGRPLRDFLEYYKVKSENLQILIIQDDSDQNSSNSKLVDKGGSAGHHGINSLNSHLMSSNYQEVPIWRLKLGIRPFNNREKSLSFVLNPISKEDDELINKIVDLIYKNLASLESLSIENAQNIFNFSLVTID